MPVTRLDHLVLTVRDLERTIAWYRDVAGMRPVTFGDGRRALAFGDQKINLHEAGHEFEPKAATPLPGSADLCFIVDERPDDLGRRLHLLGVTIELGPVPRDGAIGTLTSFYLRDPDGNLVELSSYAGDGSAGR
jgi:catechol 2,3-dioxygenase-like lactoylglutathione lyase family enzyme